MARTITSRAPASTVGEIRGSTTVKKRLKPVQPRFSEASISEASILLMAPCTYRNTSGKSWVTNTSMMPLKP